MLGLGVDDREQLAHWSDTMMAGEGADADDPRQAAAGEAWGEYITYLVGLLEERRAHPQDDLISVLLSSADAGEIAFDEDALRSVVEQGAIASGSLGLGSDDLLAFLVLLLVAGNETTRNALSGGMLALSNFPTERIKLVNDMGLVNSATEEILRYVSPVISFSRTVTRDTELRGRALAAGDVVLNVYPSANRDADVFDEPRHVPRRPFAEPAPRVRYRARTSASARTWPAPRSGSCWRSCSRGCPTSTCPRVSTPSAAPTRSSPRSSTSRWSSRRPDRPDGANMTLAGAHDGENARLPVNPLLVAWFVVGSAAALVWAAWTGSVFLFVAVAVVVVLNVAILGGGRMLLYRPNGPPQLTGRTLTPGPVPVTVDPASLSGRWVGAVALPGPLGRVYASTPMGVLDLAGAVLTLGVRPGFRGVGFRRPSPKLSPRRPRSPIFPARSAPGRPVHRCPGPGQADRIPLDQPTRGNPHHLAAAGFPVTWPVPVRRAVVRGCRRADGSLRRRWRGDDRDRGGAGGAFVADLDA